MGNVPPTATHCRIGAGAASGQGPSGVVQPGDDGGSGWVLAVGPSRCRQIPRCDGAWT